MTWKPVWWRQGASRAKPGQRERLSDGATQNVWMRQSSSRPLTTMKVVRGGEQPLPPNGSCLLGSVNIARFVEEPFTENAHINWEKFYKVVSIFTRMLDNVIEFNGLPLKEQQDEIYRKRRHGMGYMGIGSAFSMLGMRYGGDESIRLTEEITKQLALINYEVGVDLAMEKAPAPIFRGETNGVSNTHLWCESEYMKRIFQEHSDPNLQKRAMKYGCRFTHATSIAPTGCVVYDTLITTNDGFYHIEELGDINGEQWQDVSFDVSTDNGYKDASKFYINGLSPTIEVKTKAGKKLRGTEEHQIRVFDSKQGYSWKPLMNIEHGDVVISLVGDYNGGSYQKLTPYRDEYQIANGKSAFNSPDILDENIAELLGFLFSNGNVKHDGKVVRFYHHSDYFEKVYNKLSTTIKDYFGLSSHEVFREDVGLMRSFEVNSTPLIEWMSLNDICKKHSDSIKIPGPILRSPRSVIEAFFRGFFEGDGSANESSVSMTSVNEQFVRESQTILQSIGIVGRVDISNYGSDENRKGDKDVYRLSFGNLIDKKRFFNQIGFISNKGESVEPLIRNKEYNGGYRQGSASINYPFSQYYQIDCEEAIRKRIRNFIDSFEQEVTLDYVENIEHHTDVIPTYDLSVPDNLTYSSGGFISHNTIALSINNNVSNGIEPTFSHKYTRNVVEKGHNTKRAVDVYSYEMLVWNDLTGNEKVPDWFSTADNVSTHEHVDIQAAAQKWIDSSISKTVNVPTDMDFDDFKDLYLYAYQQRLKGLATFRFNPGRFQGVLIRNDDLENTNYTFVTESGEQFDLKGNEEVEYDGQTHTAANLYEALKEGTYGKY